MDDDFDLDAAMAYISPSERNGPVPEEVVDVARRAFSRRRLITHGVAVGAAAWVAPTIVAATRADAADVGSRPPKTAPPPATSPPIESPPTTQPQMGGPLPKGLPGSLPFTGAEAERNAKVGASALAAGAALWYLNRPGRTL